jgi:hypothetical protein
MSAKSFHSKKKKKEEKNRQKFRKKSTFGQITKKGDMNLKKILIFLKSRGEI